MEIDKLKEMAELTEYLNKDDEFLVGLKNIVEEDNDTTGELQEEFCN